MKRVIVLSAFALGLTLMSFSPKSTTTLQKMENGNYAIVNGANISEEDMNFLMSETQIFFGSRKRKSCSLFCTSISSDSVRETITVNESNEDDGGDGSDGDDGRDGADRNAKIQQVIKKYMD